MVFHSIASKKKKKKTRRLEQAIGNHQGPELDVLIALKRHRKSPRASCGSPDPSPRRIHRKGKGENRTIRFGARSRSPEDGGESEEVGRTPDSTSCAARPIATSSPSAEVSRLQQMVLDLQRQLQGPVAPLVVSPFRSRKREDYELATEQEVLEWLPDRKTNTASTRSLQPAVQLSSHQHNEMTCVSRSSKYGLRGVRVGRPPTQDFNHHGEPHALSVEPPFPSEELLDDLQQSCVE